jgi:hypothetical protein
LVSVDHAEPADVVDRLLWRDAQYILKRHAGPNDDGMCAWCDGPWPCAARRLAERAQEAAFKPWNEAWTTRHDMHGLRSLPGWRADLGHHAELRANRHSERRDTEVRTPEPRNRGLFD